MTTTTKNQNRLASRVLRRSSSSHASRDSFGTALRNAERSRILSSRRRLVISGETYELYEYERPYFYNRPPDKSSEASAIANPLKKGRRSDNLSSARARIRRLISANQNAYGERLKFVTFTFARNVKDLDTAHKYWAEFARRMRSRHGSLKYLAVVEFQKRGAIHYHVLYFNLPFIYGAKASLAKTWGQGFVKLITVDHVRHLGAYVSKYLQKDIMDKRLIGEKAFFCSKGLIQPQEYRNEATIAKILCDATMQGEMVRDYSSSHFGAIHYTQGKIT